jgi:hypothetical protein
MNIKSTAQTSNGSNQKSEITCHQIASCLNWEILMKIKSTAQFTTVSNQKFRNIYHQNDQIASCKKTIRMQAPKRNVTY